MNEPTEVPKVSPHVSIKDIFLAAREMPAGEERDLYLETAVGEDRELRRRVERMLASLKSSAPKRLGQAVDNLGLAALDETECSTIDISEHPTIGPYKLLERLGSGGMGEVFVAEQRKPVRRTIALKLIKRGMDSKEVIARFEAERQALALMSHSNIASVLDAGQTEDGRPYFVMDLVRGIRITEYCDQHQLTVRERLQLVVTVCQAVQHAHQKGVIHRDLKPGNILVELDEVRHVPKVIDFGVAKATNQRLTEHTLFTQFSQMIGTPLYMSPEQAQMTSMDVDTRSDVYSLGVVLYELLTGSTPFDKDTLTKAGYDEMRRIIQEDEPQRPSHRMSTLKAKQSSTLAERPQKGAPQLDRQVERELDWIVMKALEKDRVRRYESASALAADLQRYLDGDLVQACPPSVGYRLRKYAKRHKGLLTTAALLMAMLLVATGVSVSFAVQAGAERDKANEQTGKALAAQDLAERRLTETDQQRRRANANYEKAQEAVKTMVIRLADQHLSFIPEMKDVREQLLEDAATFYSELLKLNPDDPQAYSQRGHVYELLARYEAMRADCEKAAELDPDNANFQTTLASHFAHCPDVALRDKDRALVHAVRAVELAPEDSICHRVLALAHRDQGDLDGALAEYNRAIELNPRAPGSYAERRHVYMRQGHLELGLADVLKGAELAPKSAMSWLAVAEVYSALEQYDDALAAINRGLELAAPNRTTSFYLFGQRGSILYRLKRYDEALTDYNKSVQLGPFRSFTYKGRGRTHFHLSQYNEALADIAKALELNPTDLSCLTWIDTGLVANCPNEEFRTGMRALADRGVGVNDRSVASLAARASLLIAFGEWKLAQADMDAVIASEVATYYPLYQAALLSLAAHDLPRYEEFCVKMITGFADSDIPLETHFTAWACALAPNALEDYAPAITLSRHAVEKEPGKQQYMNGLGAILMRAGQYDEAKVELEKALEASDATGTSPGYTRYFLAMTEHYLGGDDAAREHLQTANISADEELAGRAPWNRKLTLELLRKETEALIENPNGASVKDGEATSDSTKSTSLPE